MKQEREKEKGKQRKSRRNETGKKGNVKYAHRILLKLGKICAKKRKEEKEKDVGGMM
jgi:uncharacterized membrane protein YvbJ